MKALIKVGYGCNDHCAFCHTLDVRHIDAEAQEVHRKIERAHELGHSMVVLSGGEPTIRPELLSWASHVAKLGMDFGLVTNGRMLCYPELVDRLMARRLRYVYLSLHGGEAKVHDLMVRSEAFEQTYGAIEVLSGRGLDFTVNCVITRHNVEHLRGLVDAVLPYPDVGLKYSMVEPKGGGDKLFDHLMPKVSRVAERVGDAIDYARERFPEAAHRVSHGAIPLCLMTGYEEAFDDLKTHRFATMIEVGEPDFFPVDDLNKIQPAESCAGCGLSGGCPGLYRGYHEAFGHDELRPVSDRMRSNSFNYVFQASLSPPRRERCLLLEEGVTPWERGRHLFVDHGDHVERFYAGTRDFSDEEIRAIKHDLGQVYLDVSDKPAPDDFGRDLRALSRSEVCDGCEHTPHCTGLFEPSPRGNVFDAAERPIKALLAGLEGDVVDLGSGAGRYHGELLERISSGAIRYLAIDPDRAALDGQPEGVERRVQRAEDWAREVEASSLDHVLMLRSWNHLADPGPVIDGIAKALRPGGSLLVADDTAFALARTKPQTTRAEGSAAEFEHFRNDRAADAARRFEGTALRLVERREAAPGTSTLWLLRFDKP